jgi:hypothetical protein
MAVYTGRVLFRHKWKRQGKDQSKKQCAGQPPHFLFLLSLFNFNCGDWAM